MRINKINIIITVMMLATVTSYAFACSIIGMIGRNGNTLTDSTSTNTNKIIYNTLLNTFKPDATANPHGFGFTYFTNGSGNLTGSGKLWNGSGINDYVSSDKRYASRYRADTAPGSAQYDTVTVEIKRTEAKIVIGNLREATTGGVGVCPTPMVYKAPDNLHALSFTHNGTVFCTSDFISQVNLYLSTHPDTVHANLLTSNDSQVYFAYLLMHIKQNNWDILRGLSSALSAVNGFDSEDATSLNFILSDGNDLYGYRREFEGNRTLQYFVLDNYAPVGRTYNFGVIGRNLTSADFSGTGILASYLSRIKNMDHDELVYIPNKGKVVSIKNFSQPNRKQLFKITNPATGGRTVFNWESFPIMMGTSDDAIQTFSQNRPAGTYYSNRGFTKANYGINIQNRKANRNTDGSWYYENSISFNTTPKAGYKINSSDSNTVVINGTLCDNATGFGSMDIGPIYWVGYWLMNSQSLREALGENFSKVRRVWAENWYYDNLENEAKTDNYPANSPDRPMEFGKMYAIQLSQFTTPITDFKWTNSRKPATGNLNMQSSFFNYNQTASYEAIDILNITKNTLPYTEIAVYDGETCIGATTVDEYPVQILAYTEGREGHTLTFRALNENGVVSEINPVIDVFDGKSGKFKPQSLVAGKIDYARVQIAEQSQAETQINQSAITEHNCYPNPFNPTTTIRFSMNQPGSVKVEIFNVKGQKVKQLFSGSLTAGKHYLTWTGKDEQNQTVGSGIYFYKIQSQNNTVTKKMILMK